MSKKEVVDIGTVDVSKLSKKQLKLMTNKKQRQQLKEVKRLGNLKTIQERTAEVNDIKNDLLRWELDERFEAIAALFAQLNLFITTGQNVCGTIPFPECPPAPMGRTIAYKFSNTRGQRGTCDLMVRNGQEYFSKEARRDLPVLSPPTNPASNYATPKQTDNPPIQEVTTHSEDDRVEILQ